VLEGRPEIVGTHHPDGVFVARGPGIRAGGAVQPLRLVDVMPTALYTAGLAIPSDVDGRIVTEMFDPEYMHVNSPKVGGATGPAPVAVAVAAAPAPQDADILARMKALGYLE
jgi:arylsulfatase A-like enzyme